MPAYLAVTTESGAERGLTRRLPRLDHVELVLFAFAAGEALAEHTPTLV